MITFRQRAGKDIARSLKRHSQVARREYSKALNRSLAIVQRNVKLETPVRTGFLRNSIRQKRASRSRLIGVVEDWTDYGFYVHEGTSRGISPNRFFERGIKKSDRLVEKEFGRAMDRVLKQVSGR